MFPLVSFFPDNTSFLGSVGALPDTFGLPAHGLDSPSGNVYLSIVGTGRGHGTSALSPIERAAVSEHDYQRAAGERGETGCALLSSVVTADSPRGAKSIRILYLSRSIAPCSKILW